LTALTVSAIVVVAVYTIFRARLPGFIQITYPVSAHADRSFIAVFRTRFGRFIAGTVAVTAIIFAVRGTAFCGFESSASPVAARAHAVFSAGGAVFIRVANAVPANRKILVAARRVD